VDTSQSEIARRAADEIWGWWRPGACLWITTPLPGYR